MEFVPLRQPFDVALRLPGSKSHANRAIVCACLARGRTVLRDATPCDDVRALVDGLRTLGFQLEWFDPDAGLLIVDGGLPSGLVDAGTVEIDCGLAGTTLRFLTAVASLVPGNWVLTGAPRLRERPIGDLVHALRALGVDVTDSEGRPPVRVRGGARRGGTLTLDPSRSSQFVSALMLIGGVLDGGLTIELSAASTSPTYVELTAAVLADFGVDVRCAPRRIVVPATPPVSAGDFVVEGDWSAAGAWLALAEMTRSRFVGSNLSAASKQGDRLLPVQLALLREPGDVELDVTDTPDQTMNLAVVAALRTGRTTIRGAANLRTKECDRLAVTCTELQKVGVAIEETADGLVIDGPTALRGAALACHGDHRMAMAFAVLGALAPGIEIDDPDCVRKSYPAFFHDLIAARHSARCIALVGMRGAGKSTLAQALGAALELDVVDTDTVFERLHGPIGAFVARAGWDAFRALESGILADAIGPGRIVACGGGAFETPGNVDLVRGRALVVWLREHEATLVTRLADGTRPPLGDAPLASEVASVLARREPIFASIADLALPPDTTVDARVTATVAWLATPFAATAPWTGVPGPA